MSSPSTELVARSLRVEISAPARIHVTLIDMNGSTGRRDGGVGFAVDAPRLRLAFRRSGELNCVGARSPGEAARTEAEVTRAAALLGCDDAVEVRLESRIPAHRGFGSGTQLRLSVLRGLAELNGRVLPPRELTGLSGRGGTSGIGCHAFLRGGLLVDGGHHADRKGAFVPSRFAEGAAVPPLLYHCAPPDDWGLVLAVPEGLEGLEGAPERDFMRAQTPLPLGEVQAVSHLVLMGLLPAVQEEDLTAFGACLTALQDVGWKRAHWRRPEMRPWRRLVDLMAAEGVAGGGLSSTGPLVYGVYDRRAHHGPELAGRIESAAGRAGLRLRSVTTTTFGGPAVVETTRGGGETR
jgi:beta-ribofuranosylaminobenzene 5'-phosphate synthase